MSALVPLHFDSFDVRLADQNGEPWFVLTDVCKVLGISNPSMVAAVLDDDERSKLNLGRQGETIIISEPALHIVILRSRQALTQGTVAHRFRRWLTHEVLPSLRKHGCYPPPDDAAQAHLVPDEGIWDGRQKTLGERFREERLRVEAENNLLIEHVPNMSKPVIREIEDNRGGIRNKNRIEYLTYAGMDVLYVLTGERTLTPGERALRDTYRMVSLEQRRQLIGRVEALKLTDAS